MSHESNLCLAKSALPRRYSRTLPQGEWHCWLSNSKWDCLEFPARKDSATDWQPFGPSGRASITQSVTRSTLSRIERPRHKLHLIKRSTTRFGFSRFICSLRHLLEQEHGQTLVGYALLVVLIAFGTTARIETLATELNIAFTDISSKLGSEVSRHRIAPEPGPLTSRFSLFGGGITGQVGSGSSPLLIFLILRSGNITSDRDIDDNLCYGSSNANQG